MRILYRAGLLLLTTLQFTVCFAAEKKVIFPPGTKLAGPYSPGILAGNFLYVSGQGAKAADGNYPATTEEQTRQCLDNIKQIVEAAGLTMDHVVYTQLYVPDASTYAGVERAWQKYFGATGPARGVLGVAKLPLDTPVEISAVVVRDLSMKKAVHATGETNGIPSAVWAGDRLYVSAAYGKDTSEALDNLGRTLKAAGIDFPNMVFVNPYVTSSISYETMNHAYASRFEFGNTPARATIEASHLPNNAAIEFTGVAIRDLSKRHAVRPKNMEPSPTASPCVFADDTFYCSAKSGFIPGPNSGVFAETVETQMRQSMRNLLDGLEEAGLTFADVVAANVYLDDVKEFAQMNRIYAMYFKDAPPTRTTVQHIAPVERKQNPKEGWPTLEQLSIIAVK